MKCERCGRTGADISGEVVLCDECLALIVREWKIRREEFGELIGRYVIKAKPGEVEALPSGNPFASAVVSLLLRRAGGAIE